MRPYGSGGRYWNLGLSNPGLLSATQKQLFYLQRLTGKNYAGKGLTVDAAADLIDQALKEKEEKRAGLTSIAEQLYSGLYKKAVDAANKAGEEWLKANSEAKFAVVDPGSNTRIGVHGTIGRAWVTWPNRGSDFYKWLIKDMYDGQKKEIRFAHKYTDRLEGELQLACERAAYEVLKRSGTSIGNIKLMYKAEDIHSSQEAA